MVTVVDHDIMVHNGKVWFKTKSRQNKPAFVTSRHETLLPTERVTRRLVPVVPSAEWSLAADAERGIGRLLQCFPVLLWCLSLGR